MQFLPLLLAMPRRCYVCGAPYLGGSVCSDRNCVRNGRRQREIWTAQQEDVESAPPVSPSPRLGGAEAAGAVPSAPVVDEAFVREMAELRGLLHELLEVSTRIIRTWGVRALHPEVLLLERVVRVWGGGYIRWNFRGR